MVFSLFTDHFCKYSDEESRNGLRTGTKGKNETKNPTAQRAAGFFYENFN